MIEDIYKEDCDKIISAAFTAGILLSYNEAKELWEAYSSTFNSGWEQLPDNNSILTEIITAWHCGSDVE